MSDVNLLIWWIISFYRFSTIISSTMVTITSRSWFASFFRSTSFITFFFLLLSFLRFRFWFWFIVHFIFEKFKWNKIIFKMNQRETNYKIKFWSYLTKSLIITIFSCSCLDSFLICKNGDSLFKLQQFYLSDKGS